MLRVAYIAETEPVVKQKSLTMKERIREEAIVTLANRRMLDKLKAKEMFVEERAQLRELELKLESILKSKTKYHV
ncbi:MAG TPA: hypothetical protein VK541_05015 [Pedobacter sp.]|uniref:hypothetical protein n=1 Tax=Pedobacter sp. TaxID=1411316 RepID=UPI002B63B7E1|nr:hypothetical protein [Pedobacter sp.]HMI01820.1 hypothetical protein [Pedobacter sp.]